jgi:hypothetical protein
MSEFTDEQNEHNHCDVLETFVGIDEAHGAINLRK